MYTVMGSDKDLWRIVNEDSGTVLTRTYSRELALVIVAALNEDISRESESTT
jgi:hypothetical protein